MVYALHAFGSDLDKSSCLQNVPAVILAEFSGSPLLPGMEYTPTEQCKLQLGPNATHCPEMPVSIIVSCMIIVIIHYTKLIPYFWSKFVLIDHMVGGFLFLSESMGDKYFAPKHQ